MSGEPLFPTNRQLIHHQRRAAQVEAWMLRAPLTPARQGWQHDALCVDCRHFDETLCVDCPVRIDCLRDAWRFEHDAADVQGIRGGLTGPERGRWFGLSQYQPPRRTA